MFNMFFSSVLTHDNSIIKPIVKPFNNDTLDSITFSPPLIKRIKLFASFSPSLAVPDGYLPILAKNLQQGLMLPLMLLF